MSFASGLTATAGASPNRCGLRAQARRHDGEHPQQAFAHRRRRVGRRDPDVRAAAQPGWKAPHARRRPEPAAILSRRDQRGRNRAFGRLMRDRGLSGRASPCRRYHHRPTMGGLSRPGAVAPAPIVLVDADPSRRWRRNGHLCHLPPLRGRPDQGRAQADRLHYRECRPDDHLGAQSQRHRRCGRNAAQAGRGPPGDCRRDHPARADAGRRGTRGDQFVVKGVDRLAEVIRLQLPDAGPTEH